MHGLERKLLDVGYRTRIEGKLDMVLDSLIPPSEYETFTSKSKDSCMDY